MVRRRADGTADATPEHVRLLSPEEAAIVDAGQVAVTPEYEPIQVDEGQSEAEVRAERLRRASGRPVVVDPVAPDRDEVTADAVASRGTAPKEAQLVGPAPKEGEPDERERVVVSGDARVSFDPRVPRI